MVEQWTFNPLVLGSRPRGRTGFAVVVSPLQRSGDARWVRSALACRDALGPPARPQRGQEVTPPRLSSIIRCNTRSWLSSATTEPSESSDSPRGWAVTGAPARRSPTLLVRRRMLETQRSSGATASRVRRTTARLPLALRSRPTSTSAAERTAAPIRQQNALSLTDGHG